MICKSNIIYYKFVFFLSPPDDNIEPQYKTRLEQSLVSPDREEFYEEDLKNLVELHPPTVMPKGNVGTPTLVFLDFIRQCLLPPKIISKLKLKFPKTTINKKYGNVPFDYEGSGQDQENVNVYWLPVTSGSGHELHLTEGRAQDQGLNGTVLSHNSEKEAREENIRVVVENYNVGAEQRTLDFVMASDSDQMIEDLGEREKRTLEVEGEQVKESGEIEEEGERDCEKEGKERKRFDEEESRSCGSSSSHQRERIKEVEVEQGERRNQWGERGLQKEGRDEEKEDTEREYESQGEKERARRKETECKDRGWVKNDKDNKNISLFKEMISCGYRLTKQNVAIIDENVKILNKEKIDEELIRKKKKELEKQKVKEKKKQEMSARRKKMALRIEEKMIEFEQGSDHSEDDVDECEEWERHEALHDDPSNQERNEERLFEQEIELKWEKGGSGLVFYTDAQFWKQQEGG